MEKLVPVRQIPRGCHNQWRSPFVSRHSHTAHLHQYQDTGQGRPEINEDWTQSSSCLNSPPSQKLRPGELNLSRREENRPHLHISICLTYKYWCIYRLLNSYLLLSKKSEVELSEYILYWKQNYIRIVFFFLLLSFFLIAILHLWSIWTAIHTHLYWLH